MPSVVGLLELHELAARRRVDELREEADRVQAELAVAEQEWQEWVIARRRVDTVLAPGDADTAEAEATADPQDAVARSTVRDAAKPKTQVPVWRQGLAWSVLSVDYQRILKALADRGRLGQGPLTCQEMAAALGMDVVPARVEALRSKAKRLVARGWLARPGAVGQHRSPRACGRPPRPRSQPGTGSSGRATAHSASVMSEGYRRTRSG